MRRRLDDEAPACGDERGSSLVEYALLLALIAVAALIAITYFGSSLGGSYSMVGSRVTGA